MSEKELAIKSDKVEKPLDPEEVWEERIAPKEDPEAIVTTGEAIRKFKWRDTPNLFEIFLDPRRIPCFRESMMSGITAGLMGMGLSIAVKGNFRRGPRWFFFAGLTGASVNWVICRIVTMRQYQLIRKTMNSNPHFLSEKAILEKVDAVLEQKKQEAKEKKAEMEQTKKE